MTNTRPRKLGTFVPLLVLALASFDAAAASLTRKPYVQQVTPDSAIVAFQTDASCEALVRSGVGSDRSRVATSTSSGREHAVRLTGLPSSSSIGYSVEACGATAGAAFRSAQPPGTRSVHFAASGDFGTGGEYEPRLAQAILARDPDLFLAAGDIAYDSGLSSEVEAKFFAPMAPLFARVPVYVALGNHEYVTDQAAPTLDRIHMPSNNPRGTERYYSFDRGFVHFVALDSMCAANAVSADLCTRDEQKRWLAADLAASDAPWKVVFFHHPPYTSSTDKDSPSIRDHFVPIFEDGGVDLVLSGHAHNYERSKPLLAGTPSPNGITYVVVGAGGARMKEWSDDPSWSAFRDNTHFGFLDVKVEGGTLTGVEYDLDGNVVDRFTLTKDLPPAPEPEPVPDGGSDETPDTGTPDTGTPDTGTPGDGTPDTGTPDGGRTDGDPDSGTTDDETPIVDEPVGCAVAGASIPALAGLVLLFSRRRRRS